MGGAGCGKDEASGGAETKGVVHDTRWNVEEDIKLHSDALSIREKRQWLRLKQVRLLSTDTAWGTTSVLVNDDSIMA